MEDKDKLIKDQDEELEILRDVREFLSLSRRFMKRLDLLKAKNISAQYVILTRDVAVQVGEKAYLYVCSSNNKSLM
ncbi:hypothetical protein [Anaerosolibacter sp.]|uniref:hypothetical protein n=1 Tax=Anaerosolibacter sp. TaxID=1872527 RepID=UPI0039F0831E